MTQGMAFNSPQHQETYETFQTIYDIVDAAAAICFVIGSALFFNEQTHTPATWFFLVGSVLFAVRPLIHVMRDIRMGRLPPGLGGAGGE